MNHFELFRQMKAKIGPDIIASMSIDERDEKLKHAMMTSRKLHPALISPEAEYKVGTDRCYSTDFEKRQNKSRPTYLENFNVECSIIWMESAVSSWSSYLTGISHIVEQLFFRVHFICRCLCFVGLFSISFAANHFLCAGFEEADWRSSRVGVETSGFTLSPVKNFSSGVVGLCCAATCPKLCESWVRLLQGRDSLPTYCTALECIL